MMVDPNTTMLQDDWWQITYNVIACIKFVNQVDHLRISKELDLAAWTQLNTMLLKHK
jgi:hypothetical protein